jgi:cytochrome b pre-mRNA-processing protein 3
MTAFLKRLGLGLGGGNTTLGVSRSLLFNCKNQASHEDWFAVNKGWVGTDFRSRHSILLVHIWLIHKRLLLCGDKSSKKQGLAIQESMFDELWDDTSNRIREAGINELSINKYLTQVQGYSFKACVELDEALTKPSRDEKVEEIAGVVWRSVYNKRDEVDEDRVLALANYVESEHTSLQNVSDNAMLEGRVAFSSVPVFQSKPTRKPQETASIEDLLASAKEKDEWKRATAATGRTYYFNVKTRETRWDLPEGVTSVN